MKKPIAAWAFVLVLGLAACFHSALDSCLAEPTYDCLIDEAVKIAGGLEDDPAQRMYVLAYVVRVMAEAGDHASAEDHLAAANQLQDRIGDAARRESMLPMLVRANAVMGRLDIAREYLGQIKDPYYAALAHNWLARGQALQGDKDGAMESLGKALSLTVDMKSLKRANITGWSAIAAAAAGHRDRVLELAKTTDKLVAAQPRLSNRIPGYATTAVALHNIGYREQALDHLSDASRALLSLEDQSPNMTERVSAVAFVVWAQTVLGEAEAARTSTGKLLKLLSRERQPGRRAVILGIAALATDFAGR